MADLPRANAGKVVGIRVSQRWWSIRPAASSQEVGGAATWVLTPASEMLQPIRVTATGIEDTTQHQSSGRPVNRHPEVGAKVLTPRPALNRALVENRRSVDSSP